MSIVSNKSLNPAEGKNALVDGQTPLSVYDLTVAYHRKPVIWDVSFDIPPGSLVGIVGPNGAGKSTLLKASHGSDSAGLGAGSVFGKTYRQNRHRVGYVPQRESVDWDFPVNALDVVAMGLYSKIGWFRPVGRKHRQSRHGSAAAGRDCRPCAAANQPAVRRPATTHLPGAGTGSGRRFVSDG